jgi:hypothetical protein
MTAITFEKLQQDRLVMSVAGALAVANETAVTQGIDPGSSLVTIAEAESAQGRVWRVHYGPRDYVSRRGGDLVIVVDEQSGMVQRITRGQ